MDAVRHYDTSWNSSTNWSIADGSLLHSVIFESSLASIAGSDQHEPALDDLTAVDSAPKSPLILCPASPDSGPCEITITFAQSHEVRQIYVRSTGRVYEIYYAPKPQSSNEYLSTVRCGVACRDEEVLLAPNFDESALAHLKGANTKLDEKTLKNDSNSNSNEDDWVEVKAPGTPLLDSGSTVSSNSVVHSSFKQIFLLYPFLGVLCSQDLYEATAEINDANPCMSITLRLLSLQNKGCVCVDELYVFADPVDIVDSETEVSQMGNAGGNSLMAMLAPTLFQLSKTAGFHRIENAEIFGSKTKETKQEDGSKSTEPLNFRNEILQEVKPSLANQREVNLQEAVAATTEPNQHEIPPLKHVTIKPDVTCGHIERSLNELVSRVSRVEDLLLKFEENMLKPISSIDARLQRVEQQLGELTKNPKTSELPSCTKFSAPEFSCQNSDNYSCNTGNESNQLDDASHEKGISSPNQLDETIYPEDLVASETGSSKDKPKHTMSIDDALASALANFLSSTSIEKEKNIQAPTVKAPEILHEEDGIIDKKVSPASEPCCLDTRDGKDSTTALVPSDCSLERIGEVTCSLNEVDSEQAAKEVVEDYQKQGPCHETVGYIDTPAKHEHQIAGDMGNGEVSSATRKILVLDEMDILNQFLEDHTDDESDIDVERSPGDKEIKGEVAKQDHHEDFLKNFLELSHASSVVNFETPILDVKFTSEDNSINKSPLEALLSDMQVTGTASCSKKSDDGSLGALLSDMQVTDTAASCSKKSDDSSQPGEDCKLISVDEADVDGMPWNLEVENLEDYPACNNHEIAETNLI
ncbi:hypothetical protein GOBAR_AA08828 [Gossypium barbadense]|uniref:Uncharacterized protein n=1 Tax=Gossypium barbadense TaxID=3634 RepID=A0A2P5Y8G0_GOSBA|nr:hypothetical protein GOBAR_AA08828 [Gossypium barbadense]